MIKCSGRLEECGAETMDEYKDGECSKCRDIMLLPAIWHDGKLWVKVPGYKTLHICIVTGEKKLIHVDES